MLCPYHAPTQINQIPPGAEPPRSSRDEREYLAQQNVLAGTEIPIQGSDSSRKDRDERERPRSRVRDISRPRRDPSPSRRERDRDGGDRDKDRRDRERDDFRRDRDDYLRNIEKEPSEADDPRRWRDDGKRDERLAARRNERQPDREYRDRTREKEPVWDMPGDRRWTVVEERDGRSKRGSARDKKLGTTGDNGKERDDRREREREKEKEPAWMDTYIPPPSIAGILGGKGTDNGDLDGIQAWKKGMKEMEQKVKAPSTSSKENAVSDQASLTETSEATERPLDEIQLFRLLMKREEAKKSPDPATANSDSAPTTDGSNSRSQTQVSNESGVFHFPTRYYNNQVIHITG